MTEFGELSYSWLGVVADRNEIQSKEGRDEQWLMGKGQRLPMGRFQTPEDAATSRFPGFR